MKFVNLRRSSIRRDYSGWAVDCPTLSCRTSHDIPHCCSISIGSPMYLLSTLIVRIFIRVDERYSTCSVRDSAFWACNALSSVVSRGAISALEPTLASYNHQWLVCLQRG